MTLPPPKEPNIIIGLVQYPVSELLKPCTPDIEPCDKMMWEHCNEEIKKALAESSSQPPNTQEVMEIEIITNDILLQMSGDTFQQTSLRIQRALLSERQAREKAEAEVERLKNFLKELCHCGGNPPLCEICIAEKSTP